MILVLVLLFAGAMPSFGQRWVATWAAASAPQLATEADMRTARLVFEDQTFRAIVHTSIGGDNVRIRVSNVGGKDFLAVERAHVARQASAGNTLAGTDRELTFGGKQSIRIPPNGIVISDPVAMDVPADANLAVSFYLKTLAMGAGIHYSALQTNYIGAGDQTAATTFRSASTISSWVFLCGVDVTAGDAASTIVAFGDSITDGSASTASANRRWPNVLAARLLAAGVTNRSVVDAGIGGNRILHDPPVNVRFGVNALARFERDVIAQPGVRYVVILEGINDLGHPGSASAPLSEAVTAEDVIAGLRQMAERAREMGIIVIGATITPFAVYTGAGYYTVEKDAHRKAINAWIRSTDAFDYVVDFEKVVQDPDHPERILAAYDSGDHLHPGDAGYKAMAEALDLTWFQ